MASLRDLVKERLAALGLQQQVLATRLDVDPSYLSAVLTGRQPVPLGRAADWIGALQMAGEDAETLVDAMHLANATERVRVLVERLQRREAEATTTLASYRDRVGEALHILTFIEPPAEPGGRYQPPPPISDPAELLRILAELILERNRLVHGLPRVADAPTRTEPSAS